MRKAIQLLHVDGQKTMDTETKEVRVYPSALVALCDDGSIWSLPLGVNSWCRAYDIPQIDSLPSLVDAIVTKEPDVDE